MVIAFRKYRTSHAQIGPFSTQQGILSVWGPVEWVLLGSGGKLLVIAIRKYITLEVWGSVGPRLQVGSPSGPLIRILLK